MDAGDIQRVGARMRTTINARCHANVDASPGIQISLPRHAKQKVLKPLRRRIPSQYIVLEVTHFHGNHGMPSGNLVESDARYDIFLIKI